MLTITQPLVLSIKGSGSTLQTLVVAALIRDTAFEKSFLYFSGGKLPSLVLLKLLAFKHEHEKVIRLYCMIMLC